MFEFFIIIANETCASYFGHSGAHIAPLYTNKPSCRVFFLKLFLSLFLLPVPFVR